MAPNVLQLQLQHPQQQPEPQSRAGDARAGPQPALLQGPRLIVLGAGAVGQAVLAVLPKMPPPTPLSHPLHQLPLKGSVQGPPSATASSMTNDPAAAAAHAHAHAAHAAAPASAGLVAARADFLAIADIAAFDYARLTIVDQREQQALIPIVQDAIARGATFLHQTFSRQNYAELLRKLAAPGDIIVDVTTGINCADVLGWCQENQVMYMNTAVEYWQEDADDPEADWLAAAEAPAEDAAAPKNGLYERTLLYRQTMIRNAIRPNGPTAILDHGMNPGLVSHFAKDSLLAVSRRVLAEAAGNTGLAPAARERVQRLTDAVHKLDFGRMAHLLGLRVIHINESDTQISNVPKRPGEFLSTWSVVGFHEEGIDPVQIGWGTHEKRLPESAVLPPTEAEQHQIFLKQRGVAVQLRSHLPVAGDIVGSAIPHSEASTLARFLSLPKRPLSLRDAAEEDQHPSHDSGSAPHGADNYRPSVYYVYDFPECAKVSWKECADNGFHLQPKWRVLDGADIASGADMVGVLLMFEEDPCARILADNDPDDGASKKPWCYWHGSILDQQEAQRIAGPHAGPTTVQVAASLLSALRWMMLNPNRGVCWPEDVDSAFILHHANPFLGKVGGAPIEWKDAPSGLQLADFLV